MLEFFPFKKTIPFMSWGKVTTAISLLTFLFAIWALWHKGLNLGVDFTGGTVMEVHTSQPADLQAIRTTLEKTGLAEVSVQNFGTSRDVLIRLPNKGEANASETSNRVMAALTPGNPTIELKRVDFVGPQVGKELYDNGALALLVVAGGIMAYLAIRFEWRFALAGMLANMHDIVIILGVFAFFQWEFTLTVLAGVLAILGYSVNESVVVFDRIRENIRKMHHHHPRLDADHGAVDAVLRRRGAAQLRPRAHHRHHVRHLLVGAGRLASAADVRRQARALHQAGGEEGRGCCVRR
jgi:preprotein translocase subunit SecF